MSNQKLYHWGDHWPKVHHSVYMADGARIMGRVHVEEDSSVWFNVVIRADVDTVHIGRGTNIQDGCVLHEDAGFPLVIGDNVTVGHNATLHGCYIGHGSVIGMGAIILNGAIIGDGCMVAAGALVPPGKEIPPRSMVMGAPAKVVRSLTDQEVAALGEMADRYRSRAQELREDYCRRGN